MKYEITGTFVNGSPWREDAKNLKELKFVCDKVIANRAVMGGFKILKKWQIITAEIMKRFYWDN